MEESKKFPDLLKPNRNLVPVRRIKILLILSGRLPPIQKLIVSLQIRTPQKPKIGNLHTKLIITLLLMITFLGNSINSKDYLSNGKKIKILQILEKLSMLFLSYNSKNLIWKLVVKKKQLELKLITLMIWMNWLKPNLKNQQEIWSINSTYLRNHHLSKNHQWELRKKTL